MKTKSYVEDNQKKNEEELLAKLNQLNNKPKKLLDQQKNNKNIIFIFLNLILINTVINNIGIEIQF